MFKCRHNPLGEQPNTLERHLLRHATEVKRTRENRDAAFFMPAPDRVAAALGIANDDDPARHVGTDVPIGKLSIGISGRM